MPVKPIPVLIHPFPDSPINTRYTKIRRSLRGRGGPLTGCGKPPPGIHSKLGHVHPSHPAVSLPPAAHHLSLLVLTFHYLGHLLQKGGKENQQFSYWSVESAQNQQNLKGN